VGGGIHGNSGGGGSGGGCSRGRGGHKGGGAGVPRPTDLYELRAALVSHAAAVHDACLLSSRDAPLLRTIDAALQLALDFRATMRRAPPDRLLADGAMYAAVQALHARFKTAARGVCRRLREAAADTGGALGGVSPAHAAALLGQLDYNGFYLGMD